MAYFLKKANQSNNLYLAIYESYYSPEVKGTRHKCYKSLGSITSLKKKGIEDPIAYYQKEVDRLNEERKNNEENVKHKSNTKDKQKKTFHPFISLSLLSQAPSSCLFFSFPKLYIKLNSD